MQKFSSQVFSISDLNVLIYGHRAYNRAWTNWLHLSYPRVVAKRNTLTRQ